MAGGYKELRDGWKYEETESGASGTRVFIEKTGGTDDLPVIGELFPLESPAVSQCIVQNITATLYHMEGTADKKKYVVNYASNAKPTNTYPTDERLWRIDASGEEIIVPPKPDTSLWVWAVGYAADPPESSDPVAEQGFAYRALVGTYTQTKVFASDAAYRTWIANTFTPKAGRLNVQGFHIAGATSDLFKRGSLMLASHSGGNKYDASNNETVPVEIVFAFKRIPVVTDSDFQYLLDVDPDDVDVMWRIPGKVGVTGPDRLIFKTTDMSGFEI